MTLNKKEHSYMLDRAYTDMMKFLLCMMIFIHHFFTTTAFPYVEWMGYVGCTIFFFFSVYGVLLSQMKKKLSLISFLRYRLTKLWVPLMFVNLTAIIIASAVNRECGAPSFTPANVHYFFYKENLLTFKTLLLLIDYQKMDSVTWFVHELLAAYLLIWVLCKINKRVFRLLLAIAFFMAVEAYFFHEVMNKWYKIDTVGILIGYLYVDYKNEISTFFSRYRAPMISICTLIFFAALFIPKFVSVQSTFIKLLLEITYSSMAVLLIILVEPYFKIQHIKLASWAGSISLYVYLIHCKVMGFLSPTTFLPCILVILLAATLFDINTLNKTK